MSPQHTIAHYRIVSKLGAGGMGEVYRATDTKLNRDVAIKVIPEAFAQDPNRMARFTREAQVLASLNHPNIAAIYGVEERALVMELVEGPTLAEHIAAGPIPFDEALPIARQIAEALAYAHDRGVVHRDLKPANIKITPDGRVKVLDFGLAKAFSGEPAAPADQAVSPTLTMNATRAGIIMGTAGYMAPEQARGKPVDKRTDIWAFGVLLLEMLTGGRVFSGETVTDTLAAVLRSEIDYSRLPPDTPVGVRRLIERCLERDPAKRLRDIGDAWIVMDPAETREQSAIPVEPRKRWLPWATAVTGALLAAAGAWYLWPQFSQEPILFEVHTPKGAVAMSPAISPDGHSIAFIGTETSRGPGIYVRALDRVELKTIPGSEGAISRPFWSPDSRRIGFFTAGRLKTVAVDGGDVQILAEGLIGGRPSQSGAWGSGVILFTQLGRPVYRTPETGGIATPVLSFDTSRQETAQLLSDFLPDGKHFLYTSMSQQGVDIYEGSLDGSKPVRVLPFAATLGYARAPRSATGYLLFFQEGKILLRPFDPASARVSGTTVALETEVSSSANPAMGALMVTTTLGSISGRTLVFAKPFGASRQITWLSREGKTIGVTGDAGNIADVRISPDGRRLAFARTDARLDIWEADLERGGATRITFNEGMAGAPVFSPDGNRIAYGSERPEGSKVLVRSSNSAGGAEPLFEGREHVQPASWSPDGRWLASIIGEPGRWDIHLLPVARDRKPVVLVATPFDEYQPQFSPDGRWIAYTSNESGRYETYIVNVPESAGGAAGVEGKWQISTAGGQQPRWRADGKELFFLSLEGQMMAVNIESSAHGFRASAPTLLFTTSLVPIGPTYLYDVSRDGQKFVTLGPVGGTAPPLSVLVNWSAALARR